MAEFISSYLILSPAFDFKARLDPATVALSYGFDRVVSGHSIPMLQSPAVWATSSTHVASVQPNCTLQLTSSN